MTECWRCNRCGKEFEHPVHNKLLVLIEKPDCEVQHVNYDMCTQCNENTMTHGKWWLTTLIESIEKELPKP